MEKIRFPESVERPEGVKEIDVKDTFGYCTELYPDVEYAEHSGRKLHLQIMTPLVYGKDQKRKGAAKTIKDGRILLTLPPYSSVYYLAE